MMGIHVLQKEGLDIEIGPLDHISVRPDPKWPLQLKNTMSMVLLLMTKLDIIGLKQWPGMIPRMNVTCTFLHIILKK